MAEYIFVPENKYLHSSPSFPQISTKYLPVIGNFLLHLSRTHPQVKSAGIASNVVTFDPNSRFLNLLLFLLLATLSSLFLSSFFSIPRFIIREFGTGIGKWGWEKEFIIFENKKLESFKYTTFIFNLNLIYCANGHNSHFASLHCRSYW